jgi:hypothetical protein
MYLAPSNELFSVLEELKLALKSIDVRTVAVCPSSDEEWQNLITSVYVTEKTVDEVQNQQTKLPELLSNDFAIFSKVTPLDYTIFDEINNGEIRFQTPFGVNKVQFRRFDPLKLKVVSTQESIDGRPYSWMLRAWDSGQPQERNKLWSVVNNQEVAAKLQGFSDIYKLMRSTLKVNLSIVFAEDQV